MPALVLILLALVGVACGGSADRVEVAETAGPLIIDVDPEAAAVGELIAVDGANFSAIPEENILLVNEAVSLGESFEILVDDPDGATQRLTFTIPDAAGLGAGEVMVARDSVFSNAVDFAVVEP